MVASCGVGRLERSRSCVRRRQRRVVQELVCCGGELGTDEWGVGVGLGSGSLGVAVGSSPVGLGVGETIGVVVGLGVEVYVASSVGWGKGLFAEETAVGAASSPPKVPGKRRQAPQENRTPTAMRLRAKRDTLMAKFCRKFLPLPKRQRAPIQFIGTPTAICRIWFFYLGVEARAW